MPYRIIAIVGFLVCACAPAARAVFVVNLTPDPGTAASGSYQLTLDQTGANTFDVLVRGNNDGVATKSAAESVLLTFKNGGDHTINMTSATGSTGAGADGSGTYTGGAWMFVSLPNSVYSGLAPSPGARLGAFGGNEFAGRLTIAGGSESDALTVHAMVGGGQEMWRGVMSIPEPAALGIVAPLATLLAARRRGR